MVSHSQLMAEARKTETGDAAWSSQEVIVLDFSQLGSACNDWSLCSYTLQRGLIHTEDEAYFMEPLPVHLHGRVTTEGKSKPHIIYRRSVILDDRHQRRIARERRAIHTCGTEGEAICMTRLENFCGCLISNYFSYFLKQQIELEFLFVIF